MIDFEKKQLSRAKSLAKAKKALANGKGYLKSYNAHDRALHKLITNPCVIPRNFVRLIYYKNNSTPIDIDEALSILLSSNLTNIQIILAVRGCRYNNFHKKLDELLTMRNEKMNLDALISAKDFNSCLDF